MCNTDWVRDLLGELNTEQRQAVLQTEGPVLILAGAGSGKTKALTHRVAYLVAEKKVAPENILAVTFTNKAAGEMRERVLKLLSMPGDRRSFPYMGTFHAICVRILRRHAESAGLTSSFIIFDQADSLSAIKRAMRQLSLDEKVYAPGLMHGLISSAKNQLVGPSDYAKVAQGPTQSTAAKVFPVYQKILREADAMDFDDLIMQTVLLFRNHPEILQSWQKQFLYIMIDEYQDTNHAQYKFCRMLSEAHNNICVVGDDWQSIYSWRGADFRNILDFKKDYPDAVTIKLEQNYRSTKNILDAAHAVISKNRSRSDKRLWTQQGEGANVAVHEAFNEVHEAQLVIEIIERGLRLGRKPKDFAVLYRVSAQSRNLEEGFLKTGLPYRIVGGLRFYERKEIKDALAYLRLVYRPDDTVSFERIYNVPARGIGEVSLGRLNGFRIQNDLTLNQALTRAKEIPGITGKAAANFENLGRQLIEYGARSGELSVSELLELIMKKSGYLDWLDDGSVQAEARVENVKELLSVAAEYHSDLEAFLQDVALMSELDDYSPTADAVTLMTLHAAKGLEFPVVIIAGFEEGVFPHSRAQEDESELEEERRLCYVGMTRAKENLHLTHARKRLLYGQTMHNPPSRFILDLAETAKPTSSEISPGTNLSLKDGDRVRHPKFGDGIVVSARGDTVTAAFAGYGTKTLLLSMAPLEKVE